MESKNCQELLENFRHPASQYRGAPFWSWNGRLEEEELRRQIRQMKAAGLGGFFMHARVGLNTPYLSEKWFNCIKACIDEARKQEMKAYLYDEDRWPSGSAGGLVTADRQYSLRMLIAETFQDPARLQPTADTIAIFRARLDGDRASQVERLAELPDKLETGESLIHFYRKLQEPSPWHNNSSYLDVLNPEAVEKFIDVTYEPYFREVGEQFGKASPAIFTDEPNYGGVNVNCGDNCRSTPWTDRLPELFRQRFGFELLDHLPELFYRVEGVPYSRALYCYMEELTTLFVNSYSRQIGEWCARHHIAFTGHVLWEDTLDLQAGFVGNCMRFYEYMQLPGMDQLGEFWQIFDTVKQLASAARQFGRQWRLTETYGCTGWHFPFAGHKAIGDWQTVLGVNLRCQHLAWYTMEGEAKRDYPAAISRQSPWFRYYGFVEDYFARLNTVLSEGREIREILVIHPIESMWLLMAGDREHNPAVKALQHGFTATRNQLLANHLDFDYGDEDILARHAEVAMVDDRPVLRVGQATYRAVVLPPLLTLRSSTLKLLQQFQAAGGLITAAVPDRLPVCLDAEEDKSLPATLQPLLTPDWLAALNLVRRVAIDDPAGRPAEVVLYQLRERKDGLALMLCNTGFPHPFSGEMVDKVRARERNRGYERLTVKVLAPAAGEWLELDPADGRTYLAEARQIPGGWELATSLAGLETRLFLLVPAGSVKAAPRPNWTVQRREPLAPAHWDYQLDEPNVAVLDFARYRIAAGEWQPETFILTIDDRIRQAMDEQPRGGAMVQPWARQPSAKPPVAIELAYRFHCDVIPHTPVYLAMEQPEAAEILINGVKLDPARSDGFWVDESLKKLPLPSGALRIGENCCTVRLAYQIDCSGLEAMFLLGDFGVRTAGTTSTLLAPPPTLATGDWVAQGLPNYSGNLAYSLDWQYRPTGERVFLKAGDIGGTALRILVNGQTVGLVGWPPYELELTDALQPGRNRLTLEVLGCRRNSHGPFYWGDLYLEWTGPTEMKACERTERLLMPSGLLTPPELLFRS